VRTITSFSLGNRWPTHPTRLSLGLNDFLQVQNLRLRAHVALAEFAVL
jgi:hypothetical protein